MGSVFLVRKMGRKFSYIYVYVYICFYVCDLPDRLRSVTIACKRFLTPGRCDATRRMCRMSQVCV